MVLRVGGIVLVTGLIVLCTMLPFLPGAYDPFAGPLSAIARVFGYVGLALVPVGAVWTALAYARRLGTGQFAIAVGALSVLSIVWGAVSLATFALAGWALGFVSVVLWLYTAFKLSRRISTLTTPVAGRLSMPALYMLVVPLAVFLLQRGLIERGIEFSRDRAIRNSAPLIADIERYRAARGHYPLSLLSVHKDYKPSIIGIDRYYYEQSGESFNVVFEQPASAFGTREFVVYNPLDQQEMTGHAMDILQYGPEQLQLARGYYAVHATRHRHWKYFWFD